MLSGHERMLRGTYFESASSRHWLVDMGCFIEETKKTSDENKKKLETLATSVADMTDFIEETKKTSDGNKKSISAITSTIAEVKILAC